MTHDVSQLAADWRTGSIWYREAVMEYLQRMERTNWENPENAPDDPRTPLADAVFRLLKAANERDEVDAFRAAFAPAHVPFSSRLEENGQHVGPTLWIDEHELVTHVGAAYESVRVAAVNPVAQTVRPQPDLIAVGRSPCGRIWALADEDGVTLRSGFAGREITRFAWPTAWGGVDEMSRRYQAPTVPPRIAQIIPWPDASAVLIVSVECIFALGGDGATLLCPDRNFDPEDDDEGLYRDETGLLKLDESMLHAAISCDGKICVVGSQSASHIVYDQKLNRIGTIGPLGSEYPHFAMFGDHDRQLIVNSCHFYNGSTARISRSDLLGIEIDDYETDDPRVRVLQDGARVYAGCFSRGHYYLGDAYGTVHQVTPDGLTVGKLFHGSTINGVDVSPSGRILAVSSYAGTIGFYELDRSPEPQQLYDFQARDWRRLLLWRTEPKPLWW